MAYDEVLSTRILDALDDRDHVTERKMFGGWALMLAGHMACGVMCDDLLVRVGRDRYEDALELPHTRPMDFTGRPMSGFVIVDAAGIAGDRELQAWVARGEAFARSLPPKY